MSETRISDTISDTQSAPAIDGALPTGDDVPVNEARSAVTEADQLGGEPLPSEKSVPRDDGTARRSGDNPFAKLTRRAAPLSTRRLADVARDLGDDLDLPFVALEKLVHSELELGPEYRQAFAKLREGAMLLTADSQALRHDDMPLDHEALSKLAETILDRQAGLKAEDIEAALTQQQRFFSGIEGDIHAFVQRVLRECYLIQSELLWDYANKVKHCNELKKRTRDRLTEVRQAHTAWASEDQALGPDVTFHADPPVPYLDLDDQGTWVPAMMSEQDVNNWTSAGGGVGNAGASGSSAAQDFYRTLYGDSRLSPADIILLKELGRHDDDFIRDHLGELTGLLSKMNADDLRSFLVPILEQMVGERSEVVELYRALDPVQFIYMISLGYEEQNLELANEWSALGVPYFTDEWNEEFILLSRQAAQELASALGVPLSELEIYRKDADKAHEIQIPEAKNILSALEAAIAESEQTATAAEAHRPSVGTPKVIRTADEMDAYIKHLEEQLNSIGDDAQLANVDLQNALQRQQQTLQMMSNISKLLHDTAMAVIRKIGQ